MLQGRNKLVIEAIQRAQQGGSPVGRDRVNHQVTVGIAKNLDPAGVKAELLGNSHRLAVAVHENSADGRLHITSFCTHFIVCILMLVCISVKRLVGLVGCARKFVAADRVIPISDGRMRYIPFYKAIAL
jgi:hypothetical protein